MAVEAVALGHKLEATLGERGFLHVARGLFQTMDERLRNGTLDGAFVFDSHEGTLIILGVVQHVQAALRAELEVGGLTESQGRKNRMDTLEFTLGIQFRGLDPAAGVFADEPATLVARRQGELCRIRLAVAIDRSGNGGFAAIAEFGKFFLQSGVPDKRRLGRWQVADAGVSRMAIHRRLGVDHGAGFLGGRIVVREGFLIGDDQRVAIKPGAFSEVEFVVTERDAFLFVQRCAGRPIVRGSVLAPKQPAGLRIHVDAEWIAQAHDINLRPRLGRAGREEVAFGNGVAALDRGSDAKNFAAEIIAVGRGLAGKQILRTDLVIAYREVQQAVRPESDGAGFVDAVLRRRTNF